jgi:hypothetical protein
MGRPAYSQSDGEIVTFPALGDANRGCAYLATKAAVSNLGDPPH